MKNESKSAIVFVIFFLSTILGASIPFHIAKYIWDKGLTKVHFIECSLPLIILAIPFILFNNGNKNKTTLCSSNITKQNVGNLPILFELIKPFFAGLGAGSLVFLIYIL
jgi:hypothetical protein